MLRERFSAERRNTWNLHLRDAATGEKIAFEDFQMEGFGDLPRNQAMEAYSHTSAPTLSEQLLYAILAQLDKISHQLDELSIEEGEK